MCFKQKWQSFTPTNEYLDKVKDIITIAKLDIFLNKIKPFADTKDYWQTPEETLNRGKGDCEDYSILAQDILVRMNIEAMFIIYTGFNRNNKKGCHAVCVFPYNGKYAMFSNNHLTEGYNDYISAGKEFYPNGLKYMEIRNNDGKVIKRKFKLIGIF